MIARSLAAALFALSLGCSGTRSAAELPPTDTPAADAPAAEAPGAPVANSPPEQVGDAPIVADGPTDGGVTLPTGTTVTPSSLYEGCRDRVEGIQVPGECTTDADCGKAGCSQEVCIASKNTGEFMSTCEVLPCFGVLETCGCHEGVCSWTVRAELPGNLPGKIPLPPK